MRKDQLLATTIAATLVTTAALAPAGPARGASQPPPGSAAPVAPAVKKAPSGKPAGTGTETGARGAPSVEEVDVRGAIYRHTGGGLMSRETAPKAISAVTQAYISRQSPSATALTLVSMMPGVNFAAADPMSATDQADMSSRGVDQPEIGYIFESVPLNFSLTGNPNTTAWADSENMARISFAQGASEIQDPTFSEVGGLLRAAMRDPADNFGGAFDASYGSFDMHREFVRLDSGYIGHSGVKAYISFSDMMVRNWRGLGPNHRRHVDFKAVKDWSADSHTSLAVTYNDLLKSAYTQPTMAQWLKQGVNYNYPGTYTPGQTTYYKNFINVWQAIVVSMPSDLRLTRHLRLNVTPYMSWARGYAPAGTLLNVAGNYYGRSFYPENLGFAPTNAAHTQFNAISTNVIQDTYAGFNTFLTAHYGRSETLFGYWYNFDNGHMDYFYQGVGANGIAPDPTGEKAITFANGVRLSNQLGNITTQTNALYVSEKIGLIPDHLDLYAGFKEVMMSRDAQNQIPGTAYVHANSAHPLPRVSLNWRLNDTHQFFIDATTNFRVSPGNNLFTSYNINNGHIAHQGAAGPDEYAIGEEVGYRYNGPVLASVTFFNTNITNRQIVTIINANQISGTVSGGGQTNRGVDGEVATRPFHHVTAYVSGEYLHATEDNNIRAIATSGLVDYLPSAGKIAVRSPKWQAALGLAYDDGTFFGDMNLKHIASQYSTFMDDEKMPAYTNVNMSVGVRGSDWGWLKRPEFRLNFINVGDAHYLSGVASPVATARGARGIYGGKIAAGSASYYVGPGFAMLGTISTSF
ncbi:TonB-dependent receptor domain-containing protein [Nguyenibacter sp. L1]|uniref:TonB-dependent receptor n=1 Tax=Nguyenibacter sp. L1 TaxID=3049350 RepID=UPI002B495A8F|nr:TonB-dependent receptor [Nguyenibacter sp. L1]WRH89535.1 TonB-dependent receptor plug domain-containing protein [Nguyenibacter sp. L1]